MAYKTHEAHVVMVSDQILVSPSMQVVRRPGSTGAMIQGHSIPRCPQHGTVHVAGEIGAR